MSTNIATRAIFVGAAIDFRFTVTENGVLTTPATVVVTILNVPSGEESTPALTNTATGTYTFSYTNLYSGRNQMRIVTTTPAGADQVFWDVENVNV